MAAISKTHGSQKQRHVPVPGARGPARASDAGHAGAVAVTKDTRLEETAEDQIRGEWRGRCDKERACAGAHGASVPEQTVVPSLLS